MWPFNRKPAQISYQAALPVPTTPATVSATSVQQSSTRAGAVVVERNAHQPQQPIDVRAENITSVIAHGEYMEGNLRFQRGLKIDGRIKGKVEFGLTDGMLVVSENGLVEGDIRGPRAIIVGEVFGNIIILGRLIILPSARIHGDVIANQLTIHEGSSINGRIRTVEDLKQPTTHQHPPTGHLGEGLAPSNVRTQEPQDISSIEQNSQSMQAAPPEPPGVLRFVAPAQAR